ncbi:MAG TPA: DinB family protein [Bryobacteraceae bacterium]
MKLFFSIALCAFFSFATFAAEGTTGQSKYSAEFVKHWKIARELTLAVADAMPAENYDFKPNPEEMGFGEQIAHIASANYSYCTRMSNGKSPFAKPDGFGKATVMKLVGESFDYCSGIITPLTDEQLNELRGPEGRQVSVRELTSGALMHMAHHRGQTEVYLRLKNIKPPTYKF